MKILLTKKVPSKNSFIIWKHFFHIIICITHLEKSLWVLKAQKEFFEKKGTNLLVIKTKDASQFSNVAEIMIEKLKTILKDEELEFFIDDEKDLFDENWENTIKKIFNLKHSFKANKTKNKRFIALKEKKNVLEWVDKVKLKEQRLYFTCNISELVAYESLGLANKNDILHHLKTYLVDERRENWVLEWICMQLDMENMWINHRSIDDLTINYFKKETKNEIYNFFEKNEFIKQMYWADLDLQSFEKIRYFAIQNGYIMLENVPALIVYFYKKEENLRYTFNEIVKFYDKYIYGWFEWLNAMYVIYYLMLSLDRIVQFNHINLNFKLEKS